MTNRDNDFLTMARTVIAIVYEFEDDWKQNIPFASLVQDINTLINDITGSLAEQMKTTKGITANKKACRKALQDELLGVSGILLFYAATAGNKVLAEQTDISERKLKQLTAMKLIGTSEIIVTVAVANVAAAAPYGLTQERLNSLTEKEAAFIKIVNAPRQARTGKKEATLSIAASMATLRYMLTKRLDKAMVLYRDNLSFSKKYRIARRIVNSPVHHLALMVAVTDGNGKPLPGAIARVVTGDKSVQRKTSPRGNIRVKHLPDGSHVLTLEKPGFITQTVSFTTASPGTTRLQVVMNMG